MAADLAAFNSVLQRLEKVADRFEAGVGKSGSSGAAGADSDSPLVSSFDEFVQAKFAPITAAAEALGSAEVTEVTKFFVQGTTLVRDILQASTCCKKPKDEDWAKFFGPISELSGKANKACDNRNAFYSNQKSAAEGLQYMTFMITPSPPSHVQNALEAMDFHAIKVLQKKIPLETAWMSALKQSLKDLKDWCSDNCKLGLTWKFDGEDAVPYFERKPLGGGGGASPAAAAPAPKAAAAAAAPRASGVAAGGGGMASMLGAIQGTNASGLKKVTDDQKTKNRSEEEKKAAAAVPAAKAAGPSGGQRASAALAALARGKGPRGAPIKGLVKNNWMVENYEADHAITIDEVSINNLVCIINCKNCTIRLNGRCKNVSVDGCEKVNVITKEVLSCVELVNSDRCAVQADGQVNSFAIDKCNGVQLWLGEASLAAEITSSKSSEMNVTIPDPANKEEVIEIPIPEQFVTRVQTGTKKLKTGVSSIYQS